LKLTEYLAVYAAGLSTIVFVWNLLRAKSRIKVRLIPGTDTVDGETQFGVYIFVQNVSGHAVHLGGVSVLYPYKVARMSEGLSHLIRFGRLPRTIGWVHSGLSNSNIQDGCPRSLEARQSHRIFISEAVLETLLEDAVRREIRAVVQDQLWRDTYSNKLKIDWTFEKE
jgi:hypothetical protein